MFSPAPNPRPAAPSWRATVRRAVDLAVAFATLESCTTASDLWSGGTDAAPASASPHGPVEHPAPHPHRVPLSAQVRPGRAGTVPARTHCCITPHRAHPRQRSAHPSAR
jgi:hypothetical protein